MLFDSGLHYCGCHPSLPWQSVLKATTMHHQDLISNTMWAQLFHLHICFDCAGHRFSSQGLSPCTLNTAAAAVGTKFSITFTVYDHAIPPLQSSASRTVLVVSPCSPGTHLCRAVRWSCTLSSCLQLLCLLWTPGCPCICLSSTIVLSLHSSCRHLISSSPARGVKDPNS